MTANITPAAYGPQSGDAAALMGTCTEGHRSVTIENVHAAPDAPAHLARACGACGARATLDTKPEGDLWARASDLDAHPIGRNGTVLCFRVMEGIGVQSHAADRHQYPTQEAAERAAERYSDAHRAMFRVRVVTSPYFTKSGRVVKSTMRAA
jgi:xanthine/CO dehydrogenase XdhC/CoxF family maturation factor